jgi:hypothetical protein
MALCVRRVLACKTECTNTPPAAPQAGSVWAAWPVPGAEQGCRAQTQSAERNTPERCESPGLPDSAQANASLSLPAGTGKGPCQFSTLGQASAEFSKPLDRSGLFKNNPGTSRFPHLPFPLPQQGRWDILWGLSATSRVSWSLLPRAPWGEMHVPYSRHPGSFYLDFCLLPEAGLLGHPAPIPTSYG